MVRYSEESLKAFNKSLTDHLTKERDRLVALCHEGCSACSKNRKCLVLPKKWTAENKVKDYIQNHPCTPSDILKKVQALIPTVNTIPPDTTNTQASNPANDDKVPAKKNALEIHDINDEVVDLCGGQCAAPRRKAHNNKGEQRQVTLVVNRDTLEAELILSSVSVGVTVSTSKHAPSGLQMIHTTGGM